MLLLSTLRKDGPEERLKVGDRAHHDSIVRMSMGLRFSDESEAWWVRVLSIDGWQIYYFEARDHGSPSPLAIIWTGTELM